MATSRLRGCYLTKVTSNQDECNGKLFPSLPQGYTDEPIGKILSNIANSDTVLLDRWNLKMEPNPDGEDSSDGKDTLPLSVVNNYYSLGVDAHIALEFHEARGKRLPLRDRHYGRIQLSSIISPRHHNNPFLSSFLRAIYTPSTRLTL